MSSANDRSRSAARRIVYEHVDGNRKLRVVIVPHHVGDLVEVENWRGSVCHSVTIHPGCESRVAAAILEAARQAAPDEVAS